MAHPPWKPGDPHRDTPALMDVAARPSAERERPDLPTWGFLAGIVLVLVFVGLVVQFYLGPSLIGRLVTLVPGFGPGNLMEADRTRVTYVSGDTVQVGQVSIGKRGQDRPFQPGDVVLLGATGKLVRLLDGDLQVAIQASEGATVQVINLGAWNSEHGSLAGATARNVGGAWAVDPPQHQPVGVELHLSGAPEEELSEGFQLMPPTAGRIRRVERSSGPMLRLRPSGRTAFLFIESRDPLPSLDFGTVTVRATVRVAEGATVELALNDVVNASGAVRKTADRRTSTNADEWLTLQVQRRVVFGSPDDRLSIGLLDVRNRDWLEIGEFGVYLGVLP